MPLPNPHPPPTRYLNLNVQLQNPASSPSSHSALEVNTIRYTLILKYSVSILQCVSKVPLSHVKRSLNENKSGVGVGRTEPYGELPTVGAMLLPPARTPAELEGVSSGEGRSIFSDETGSTGPLAPDFSFACWVTGQSLPGLAKSTGHSERLAGSQPTSGERLYMGTSVYAHDGEWQADKTESN